MLKHRRFYIVGLMVTLSILWYLSFWTLSGDQRNAPTYILLGPKNSTLSSSKTELINNLSIDDETTLIDIEKFEFTINHDPCNNTEPLLLVIIHSAPNHFKKRSIIRHTWGKSRRSDVIVLFTIGKADEYQFKITEENKKYRDIIQGNFIDAYRNMTYKHVMGLKWATYYCLHTKYVLKVDDDTFVNMKALISFLKRDLSPWGARRLMLCHIYLNAVVQRSKVSKWQVSPSEYPEYYYPKYCEGFAILYSPDIVYELYRAAQKEPYFWIDDVHITGIIAEKVNLSRESISSHVLTREEMNELINYPNLRQDFLFGPHDLNGDEIIGLHRWSLANNDN